MKRKQIDDTTDSTLQNAACKIRKVENKLSEPTVSLIKIISFVILEENINWFNCY